MDWLEQLAEKIKKLTGLQCFIMPENAITDSGEPAFILEVTGGFSEADVESTESNQLSYSFAENEAIDSEFCTLALPISLTFQAAGYGDTFRADCLQFSRKFSKLFKNPLKVNHTQYFGEAREMIKNKIGAYPEDSDDSLFFIAELQRNIEKDVAFEENNITNAQGEEINAGFVFQQNWRGNIFITDIVNEEV